MKNYLLNNGFISTQDETILARKLTVSKDSYLWEFW